MTCKSILSRLYRFPVGYNSLPLKLDGYNLKCVTIFSWIYVVIVTIIMIVIFSVRYNDVQEIDALELGPAYLLTSNTLENLELDNLISTSFLNDYQIPPEDVYELYAGQNRSDYKLCVPPYEVDGDFFFCNNVSIPRKMVNCKDNHEKTCVLTLTKEVLLCHIGNLGKFPLMYEYQRYNGQYYVYLSEYLGNQASCIDIEARWDGATSPLYTIGANISDVESLYNKFVDSRGLKKFHQVKISISTRMSLAEMLSYVLSFLSILPFVNRLLLSNVIMDDRDQSNYIVL